ncbi:(deoxy)nucleoside triphosphate pyrophosphohydrolase [soil metagenome]
MGAAIIHDRRVLAARRASPPAVAGWWEFPGGKLELGESPAEAVVREVREELSCEVSVTGTLTGETSIRGGFVLRVATAELVRGEPVPHEHDAIWWLGAGELGRVGWLAPDLPFLPDLRRRLEMLR